MKRRLNRRRLLRVLFGPDYTPGGGRSIACTWNGIEYESIFAAAKANGISACTMRARIERGYTSDDEVRGRRRIVWNGEVYHTLTAAAQARGVNPTTIKRWLDRGYTCDSDVKRRRTA